MTTNRNIKREGYAKLDFLAYSSYYLLALPFKVYNAVVL
jgi:hypothetical protein